MTTIGNKLELAREALEKVQRAAMLEVESSSSTHRRKPSPAYRKEKLAESSFLLRGMAELLNGHRDDLESHDEDLPKNALEALQYGFREVTESLDPAPGHIGLITASQGPWPFTIQKMSTATFTDHVDSLLGFMDAAIELVNEAERLGIEPTDVVQYCPEMLEPFEFAHPVELPATRAYEQRFDL